MLREECVEVVASLLNSSKTISKPRNQEGIRSNAGAGKGDEADWEENNNDGCVQITMEICRPIRSNLGSIIPIRDTLSPCFLTLAPIILSKVKRVRFVVWAGWMWWSGPQRRPAELQLARRIRSTHCLTPDQMDETAYASSMAKFVEPNEPDPLTDTLDAVLEHLPLVDTVEVVAPLHVSDYWNWDLPQKKWKGVEGWLESPICESGKRRWKSVQRSLVVCQPPTESLQLVFYRKTEVWERDSTDPDNAMGREVRITEKTAEIPDEWPNQTEIEYETREYSRIE